ncbi:hypothetical protein [Nocardia sp. NPDC051981]|uniref:hypothetical protein n=1 Tax=Nocardia sp. NPDC051981 TaxID=3155417 RepID=UPI003441822D
MTDPYGSTFPPPAFAAPPESGHRPGVLERMRSAVFVAAPVVALVGMVGVLAVVIYRGEHPATADPGRNRRAGVSTTVSASPVLPVVHAS